MVGPLTQGRENRVRLVLPDGTERAVTDVPEGVPLPELREVDVPLTVDICDALAGQVGVMSTEKYLSLPFNRRTRRGSA